MKRVIILSFGILFLMWVAGCGVNCPSGGFKVNGTLSQGNLDFLSPSKTKVKYTIDYSKDPTTSRCTSRTRGNQVVVLLPLGSALNDAISEAIRNSFVVDENDYDYLLTITIKSTSALHEFSGVEDCVIDKASLVAAVNIQIQDSDKKPVIDKTF